jgi:hypothetical protein
MYLEPFLKAQNYMKIPYFQAHADEKSFLQRKVHPHSNSHNTAVLG